MKSKSQKQNVFGSFDELSKLLVSNENKDTTDKDSNSKTSTPLKSNTSKDNLSENKTQTDQSQKQFQKDSAVKKPFNKDFKKTFPSKGSRKHSSNSDKRKPRRDAQRIDFDYGRFQKSKEEGLKLLDAKKYDKAIASFTKVIDNTLQFVRKARETAEKKKAQKNIDGALKDYAVINKIFTRLMSVFYARSLCKVYTGDTVGAESDLDMVLKYQSEHKKAYLKRGQLKKDSGRLEEALKDFKLSLLGDDEKEFKTLYLIAEINFDLSNHEDAFSFYKKGLASDPNHPKLHFEKGLAAHKKGNLDKAIRELDHAISKSKKLIRPFESWLKENNKSVLEVIEIDIEKMLLCRGDLFRQKGLLEDAIKNYSMILSLNAENFKALIKRGETYFDFKNFKASIDDYSKMLQWSDCPLSVFWKRGQAYTQSKQFEKAICDFDTLISKEPFNVPVYGYRAKVNLLLGNWDKAIIDLQKVLEFKAKDIQILKALFYANYKSEKYTELQTVFNLIDDNELNLGILVSEINSLGKKNNNNELLQKVERKLTQLFQLFNYENTEIPEIKALSASLLEQTKKVSFIRDELLVLFLGEARALCSTGKQNDCLELLGVLEKQYEANREFGYITGKCYYSLKQYSKAIALFTELTKKDTRDDEAHYFLAKSFEAKGDLKLALKEYQQAVKLNPDRIDYHIAQARILEQEDKLDGAFLSLKKALQIDKENIKALKMVVSLYLLDGKFQNLPEALKNARLLFKKNSSVVNGKILIEVLLKNDHGSEAKSLFDSLESQFQEPLRDELLEKLKNIQDINQNVIQH